MYARCSLLVGRMSSGGGVFVVYCCSSVCNKHPPPQNEASKSIVGQAALRSGRAPSACCRGTQVGSGRDGEMAQLCSVCSSPSSRPAQACPSHGREGASEPEDPMHRPFSGFCRYRICEQPAGQGSSHGQALVTRGGTARPRGQGLGKGGVKPTTGRDRILQRA